MARDAGGNYTAPSNSWNPAISGTQLNSDDWNATQQDYEVALSESVFTAAVTGVNERIIVADGTSGKKVKESATTLADLPTTSDNITWTGNHTFNGAGVLTINQGVEHSTGPFNIDGSSFGVSATATFTAQLNSNGALVCGSTLQVTGEAEFNNPTLAIDCNGPADFADTVDITGLVTAGTINAISLTADNLTANTSATVPSLQVGTTAGPSAGSITVQNDITVAGISSLKSTNCDDLTAANDITSTSGNVVAGAHYSQVASGVAASGTVDFTPPFSSGIVHVVRSDDFGSTQFYSGGYDGAGVAATAVAVQGDAIRTPSHGSETRMNGDTADPAFNEMDVSVVGGLIRVTNNSGTTASYRVTFF